MAVDLSHKKQVQAAQEYAGKHPGEVMAAYNHFLNGMQATIHLLHDKYVQTLEGKTLEIKNGIVQFSFAAAMHKMLDGGTALEFGPPVSTQLVDQWMENHDRHPQGVNVAALRTYLQNFIEFTIKNNCDNGNG